MEDDVLDASGIDPFEEPVNNPPEPPQNPDEGDAGSGGSNNQPPASESEDRELIYSILRDNNVSDPSKINWKVGDKETVRQWNDLSKDEKLSILRSGYAATTDEYSQDEKDLIKQIRDSGLSPADYIASKENSASQATQSQIYKIDEMDADTLFILDQMDRLGEENVTDEQLQKLLNDAKSDPQLYELQINKLREQYKRAEDEHKFQEQQKQQAQEDQEFQQFSEAVLREIQSLDEIAGQAIELSVDDKNDVANYILTRDENNNSEFGKDMNDIKFFTKAAFWALKGNDIMKEISSQIKTAYEKGYQEGLKGQSKLVIDPTKKDPKGPSNSALSAAALDVT